MYLHHMKRSGNGEALVSLWDWAGRDGQMNRSTAAQYATACTKVLSSRNERLQDIDVLTLDVDAYVKDFRRKYGHLEPQTRDTYASIFRRSVLSFRDYIQDPVSWVPPTRSRRAAGRPATGTHTQVNSNQPTSDSSRSERQSEGVQDISIPLPTGRTARLIIPNGLSPAEVQLLQQVVPAYVGAAAKQPVS